MPQGSVLGMLSFLLYTSELLSILENKLIGYADDYTLMAVVPSTGVRVAAVESLIRDLGRGGEWCDLCNDLANRIFDGVGLAGLKSRANASLLA